MTARRTTDWEAIEREFRAGQLSVREIARQHGVTDGAIRKRAAAHGWERDLSGQVRETVRSRLVRTEVRTANAREAVDAAAARGVDVVLRHRRRLSRLGELADRLAERAEVALSSAEPMALDALADAAQTVESVGRAVDRLIKGERQAFGLDAPDASEDDDALAERLARAKRRLTPDA
jgi:transposase-like protein